jgi:hypothetical protein
LFYVESTIVTVICETQIARHETFECTNPQINQFLTKQGIADPEAHNRYGIEKTQREEVLALLGGTKLALLDILTNG